MAVPSITTHNDEELFSSKSLQDLCVACCSKHAKTIVFYSNPTLKVRNSFSLPLDIWDKLVQQFDPFAEDFPQLAQAIHSSVPHLKHVNVRNAVFLKDTDLSVLMLNSPRSLDIHNCPCLTNAALDIINKLGGNLESLCIGSSFQILPVTLNGWITIQNENKRKPSGIQRFTSAVTSLFKGQPLPQQKPDIPSILQTPKLKKLVIWGLHVTQQQFVKFDETKTEDGVTFKKQIVDYWTFLTHEFIDNLISLDLSSCQEITSLEFLIPAASTLTHLHLHDVLMEYDVKTWGVLRNLTKLRYLDVSQYNELASVFYEPDKILEQLVQSFPDLQGLDISGTNLAGFEPPRSPLSMICSIPGLAARASNPLQFLGLLESHYSASSRSNIPALQVSGGDSVPQILFTLKIYLHRSNLLRKTVRLLHTKLGGIPLEEYVPCYALLEKLIQGINLHLDDKHTVIILLACVFDLIRRICCGLPEKVCESQLRQCLETVLKAMWLPDKDLSLMRNGILILLLLLIPARFQLTVDDTAKIVPAVIAAGLSAASSPTIDAFLIRAIAHILHLVICSEDQAVMNAIYKSSVTRSLCSFMEELLMKSYLDQMSTFFIIFLRFTEHSNNTMDQCWVDDGVIRLCFQLITVCQKETGQNVLNRDLYALREIQKSILSFLTNLLHEANPNADFSITSDQVQCVLNIVNGPVPRDRDLAFICCGFLSQIVEMKSIKIYLDCGFPLSKVLDIISHVMSKLDSNYPYRFTFRNLDQIYDHLEYSANPEVHLWSMWTLVKLCENDGRFIEMIVADDILNLSSLMNDYMRRPQFQKLENLLFLTNRLQRLIIDNRKNIQ